MPFRKIGTGTNLWLDAGQKVPFARLRTILQPLSLWPLLALAAAFFSDMGGKEYQGRFQVLDGDSLQQGEVRFRLEGIDAPEGKQTCGSSAEPWPCGRRRPNICVSGSHPVQPVCRGAGADRYARTLVRCTIGGSDINAEMVRRGWAVSYGLYQHEESEARRERAGIGRVNSQDPRTGVRFMAVQTVPILAMRLPVG